MKNVAVVIGPGQIGQAIARRVGIGKHVLLADMRRENADAAATVMANAGYEVSVATVDVSSRAAVHALVETATSLGEVTGLIHAAARAGLKTQCSCAVIATPIGRGRQDFKELNSDPQPIRTCQREPINHPPI
jgi:NAD(P)-dependent dehydrogenase (short-subunit alcohol dehydrogenase family)